MYTSKLTGGGEGVGPLKKLNRKRDICTLDYSKRVMNNHAGSTLTRPTSATRDHITGTSGRLVDRRISYSNKLYIPLLLKRLL